MGLKQDALPSLVLNFALEYMITEVPRISERNEIEWDT
jgi:hypothetical protein